MIQLSVIITLFDIHVLVFCIFFLTFCRKFPDIFCQFKVMLGFKEPSTAEMSPEPTPPPQVLPKERVTEFAAEIGLSTSFG